jgi:glucose/arabinose dehydrogenase
MRRVLGAALTLMLLGATVMPHGRAAGAVTLPSGFQEQIVFTGLDHPTNIEFAPDGRVFVAEKRGVIKVFDNLADTTPTVYADLQYNVHNLWDRGLLGMALHPDFAGFPWVYVLYTYDAPPGQAAPRWATGPGYNNENCDAVGGLYGGNCVVTGRLSRINAAGQEQALLSGQWCQQFSSHSLGDLKFGADGMLYVSAGDGASFANVDYGQFGNPLNPCSDAPGEGGALRVQDIVAGTDPVALNGSLLRLDPETGLAAPGNPYIGSPDLNKRRVIANGLRNPYRFTIRPGSNEVWIGDVGWNTWEEIDRVADPLATPTANFGWPCMEGSAHMPGYDNINTPICESLYTSGSTVPYSSYSHSGAIVPGETCAPNGYSVTGLAFDPPQVNGSYPSSYTGALFFADYARGCIWAMKPTIPGGNPDPANIEAFAQMAAMPVDLELGPGGELYYVDHGGTVRRFRYFPANQPPTANIVATPGVGPAPLAVHFDGSNSTDADPADQGRLTFQWDFTNDGTWDATGAAVDFTYPGSTVYTARMRAMDTLGAWDEETITIDALGFPPTPAIDTPISGTTWTAGQTVSFTGHAVDAESGPIGASALSWELRLQHCQAPNSCHTHVLEQWNGVASGSFVAPDHEYPAYLELALTAHDPSGQIGTLVRRLDPQTVRLNISSRPTGIPVTVGSFTGATPYSIEVIKGSTKTVSAPATYDLGGDRYAFFLWSDYGAPAHVITADETSALKAIYYRCGGWYAFLRPAPCKRSPIPNRRYVGTRPFA